MARETWPQRKCKLVATSHLPFLVGFCVFLWIFCPVASGQKNETEIGRVEPIEGRSDLTLPRNLGYNLQSGYNHDVFRNDSYHLNYTKTHHKRRRKGKGKRKRRRKGRKKKRKFVAFESHVERASAFPVIESTVIRTSEDDNPRNRLLIETVRTDSKPEVRYYPNYPLQWEEGVLRKSYDARIRFSPVTTPGPAGRIYIVQSPPGRHHQEPGRFLPGRRNHTHPTQIDQKGTPHYDSHLNWMGLKYGKSEYLNVSAPSN